MAQKRDYDKQSRELSTKNQQQNIHHKYIKTAIVVVMLWCF